MNIKQITYLMGLCVAIATYITFAITFVTAYLEPTKRVIFAIDIYHEALLELVLFVFIGLPCVTYMFLHTLTIMNESEEYD
jgi:hypothetical protein